MNNTELYPSEKPMKEKKRSSKTNWERVDEMSDEDIDYTDSPELDNQFWQNAKLVVPKKKERLSMRIDSDVLVWFKEKGKGYQTMINSVLKSYVDAQKSQS